MQHGAAHSVEKQGKAAQLSKEQTQTQTQTQAQAQARARAHTHSHVRAHTHRVGDTILWNRSGDTPGRPATV